MQCTSSASVLMQCKLRASKCASQLVILPIVMLRSSERRGELEGSLPKRSTNVVEASFRTRPVLPQIGHAAD